MFGIDDAIAIPAMASVVSGLFNNSAAASRQEDQQAFNAQQYATRYQTQVKDLQAAGLNPMLSYMQSPGAGASSGIAASSGMPDVGATISQSRIASAQSAKLNADTALVQSEKEGVDLDNAIKAKYGIARAEADLNQVLSATGVNLETQGRIIAESEKISQEILNLKTTNDQVKALIANLQQQNKLLEKQGLSEVQRAAMLSAQARFITGQARMQEFDIDAVIKTGGIGRLARETKPVSDIASDWLSPGKWLDKLLPSKFQTLKGK